jgi:hypothetical protein
VTLLQSADDAGARCAGDELGKAAKNQNERHIIKQMNERRRV